jgi:hypothetical protein
MSSIETAYHIHNKDKMLDHIISNLQILDDYYLLQDIIDKTPNIEMQIFLQSIMNKLKKNNFDTNDEIKINIIMMSDPMQSRRKNSKPVPFRRLSSMTLSDLRHLLYVRPPVSLKNDTMTRKEINCLIREELCDFIKNMYIGEFE